MGGKLAGVEIDRSAPQLSSLAPEYSFSAHGVYFTILKKAIDTQPDVRNIALAGPYGTGKSSILRQVADAFDGRVVELSLLTLGMRPEPVVPGGDTNPAAASTTNRIQKEIVKQLLYQQRPAKAPASRFRRIGRFRWGPELLIAGIAGGVAVLLGIAVGLDVVVSPSLSVTVSGRPHAFAVIGLFLIVALIAGGTTLLARALARGRVGVEKVTAGPATITLPPRSVSYFDEYLDEIIYFFETNRKLDLVIIEDLDRFNDPNIFEALRSLNRLLNAAQQLGGRKIRFIYAVRDSVFEKLGQDSTSVADEARAELARANRTKFFELVVPVVPFITHKNARDLMSEQIEQRGHRISKDLVDLAARHLADMRLIHNVLNEYEVFKHRLLDVETPVPELDPDRLFAMILFKNAHMGDFEKIRHGESTLDSLWDTWRELVRANEERLRMENRDLRSSASKSTAATKYAQELGTRIRAQISALASAPGSGFATSDLSYAGAKVTDAKLQSPEFWRAFIEDGGSLTLQAHAYYGSQTTQLNQKVLETLVGRSLESAQFEEDSVADAEASIQRNNGDLELLNRHTWQKLATYARFTYLKAGHERPLSFRGWAEELLPSQLAVDLVVNGYITSYFPLHVSSFYGKLIRPDAMTYVMRFIDHGRADYDYPLDGDDVDSILWDLGTSVLSEPSMFNIGILNHLLAERPTDADTVVTSILNSTDGTSFTDRYLESGAQKREFVARLTPLRPDIYLHLHTTQMLADVERVTLMDTAISNRAPTVRYRVSHGLRAFLEDVYRDLPGLATDAAEGATEKVVKFFSYMDVVVPSLLGLPSDAIISFRSTRAYRLDRENLELIVDSSDISLDQLEATDHEVFAYAAASAEEYAKAFLDTATTRYTVASPELLINFLDAADKAELSALDTVVANAEPACRIPELSEVPPATWPTIVRNDRTFMTLANVEAYIDEYGEVDGSLAESLAAASAIADAAPAELPRRVKVALAILNSEADNLAASQRVELARSLDTGVLLTEQIEPRAGSLVGDLLAAELIEDDEDAFSTRLMVDWATQSHAIANSKCFADMISPTTLAPHFVAPLLREAAHSSLHLKVARAFSSYTSLPGDAYQAYAERALAGAYLPNAAGISNARAGGVSVKTTIALLARFIGRMSTDELRAILRTLGSPWSRVADPGFGITGIDDSPDARTVLAALQGAGVVSKFPSRDGQLRVSLRQK